MKDEQHFWDDILRREIRRDDKRRAVTELVAGGRVARFVHKDGRSVIVHPCVRADRSSEWQLSTLDADGIPSGHTCPPDFLEGCLRASGVGMEAYWNEFGYCFGEVVR